jgi:hypothetical protein
MAYANYVPYPILRFYDNNNNPLAGGKIYTYLAGTTTLAATFQDPYTTVINTNPIILDSNGEALVYLYTDRSYKFLIRNSADVTIKTIDQITTIAKPTVAGNALISAADVPAQKSILGIDNFSNRNYIINSNFDVWQRGTSFSLGTAGVYGYTADRWVCKLVSGTGSVEASRYAVSSQTWNAQNGNEYAIRIYNSDYYNYITYELGTRIEGVQTLSGKTVTLSFYYYSGAIPRTCAVSIIQNYGTGGSPSAPVTHTGNITLSSYAAVRASITFSLQYAFGTVGTNGDDHLYVKIQTTTENGASAFPTYYWGFQLEEGSIATRYENIPYAANLINCQRYYHKLTSDYIGDAFSTSAISGRYTYPVEMRVAPTITNGSFNAGTFASNNIGTKGARLYNSAANWTIGTSITASAEFSAEL